MSVESEVIKDDINSNNADPDTPYFKSDRDDYTPAFPSKTM